MADTTSTAAPRALGAMVADVIAETLGLDAATVAPELALEGDALACDQLERLEIAIRLEEIFDVAIGDDDLFACATVADLVALLRKLGAAEGG